MTRLDDAAGELVLLGRITKPHGIRGEVKIYPYSEQPENFRQYRRVLVDAGREGERIPLNIDKTRIQGKQVILKLQGCDDRDAAEGLAGRDIWLPRGELPSLAEDEYYWADLEGRTAVTEDGRTLGRITGIMDTGAHDVLSVIGGGREYLVPMRREFVVRMDKEQVVLRLPPGLLDINPA